MEAQVEEIDSLKAEAKVVKKTAVRHFIDYFKEHPLYNTFANFWATLNAQTMLEQLREVDPTLDISTLEVEFESLLKVSQTLQLLRRLLRLHRKWRRNG